MNLGGDAIVTHSRVSRVDTRYQPGVSEPDRTQAWVLTRSLSPRDRVRAAARLVTGEVLNEYDREWSINQLPPSTPWAMYLADELHRYRYLCFDFDSSRGNAPYDAGRFSLWLDELNITHLVCESGPTGGRHVWLGMVEPVAAEQAKEIALLAVQLLPSLDPTPLTNPATGCVRPPGAPHRMGGVSLAQGSLSALTSTPVSEDAVADLRAFLLDAGAEIVPPQAALLRGMAIDEDGHPYIAGPKRPLTPRVEAMLNEPPADDASYTLATVLAGCAHARWRYQDVMQLVDTAAFEHIRTLRGKAGGVRVPRTDRGRIRAISSAWNAAVRYVASHPLNGSGDDTDYQARSATVLQAVERVQERADAMPGLWGADRASSRARRSTGTHSTRAVLDALCLYMAQSAQLVVEADIRRLSADTGYGRSTVHTALQVLARPRDEGDESAWIVRVGESEPPHGQRYRLSERFSTGLDDHNRTQVLARPGASATPRNRGYWITRLSHELTPLRHDTFAAPGSLGRTAGLVFKYLPLRGETSVAELSSRTGLDADRVRSALHRLEYHGLARRIAGAWSRDEEAALDQVAEELEVVGYLEARRACYNVERGVWAWWQAEYRWMTKANKKRRQRRAATGVALFAQDDRPDYPQYPRGPDHRGDHRHARRLVEAGALSPTRLESVA